MLRSFTIVTLFVLFSFLFLATAVKSQTPAATPSPAREIPTDVTNTHPTVDQVIERAEAYFKSGKMNLEDNKRDAARADFDRAIDEILSSGYDVRANKRLENFYTELVERIYREEVPLTQPRSAPKLIVESSATATPTPTIGFRQSGFQPSPLDPLSKLVLPDPQDKPSDDSNTIKYRARKGDTIAKIAAAQGLSTDVVSKLNGIAANAQLQAGQEIKLPMIATQLDSLHSEYLKSTREYKASLERLLALYQESEKKAEDRLTQAKKLYDEKLLFQPDLDQVQKAVEDAKLKVQLTQQQIATADKQIADAVVEVRERQINQARNRERADELIGPKPAQSANGTMPIVIKWFNDYLHDPYSAHYVSWTKVRKGIHDGEPFWIVAVRIRAKNAFNAYRLSDYVFYIRRNRIVLYDTD